MTDQVQAQAQAHDFSALINKIDKTLHSLSIDTFKEKCKDLFLK